MCCGILCLSVLLEVGNDLVYNLDGRIALSLRLADLLWVTPALCDEVVATPPCQLCLESARACWGFCRQVVTRANLHVQHCVSVRRMSKQSNGSWAESRANDSQFWWCRLSQGSATVCVRWRGRCGACGCAPICRGECMKHTLVQTSNSRLAKLPKSVRRLTTHAQASKAALFSSKLSTCLFKEWLVR